MAKQYKWNYVIHDQQCMACAACEFECRDEAVMIEDFAYYRIDDSRCTRCARCFNACPAQAIERVAVS